MTHREEPPGPPPRRFFLTSGHPQPPLPITWKFAPTSVAPSVGCTLLPASILLMPIRLYQGSLRIRLGQGGNHMQRSQLLSLLVPPPPPVSADSVPLPSGKIQLQGAGRLGTCGTKKFCIWGTKVNLKWIETLKFKCKYVDYDVDSDVVDETGSGNY